MEMTHIDKAFIVATSTLKDGNMSFRFGGVADVIKSRTNFLSSHNLQYQNCVVMRSEHKDIVKIVDATTPCGPQDINESLEADALITQIRHHPLLLTTADCLPLTLYDASTNTVGLIHLSRHTLARRLIEKTLTTMQTEFGIKSSGLVINIGPHIHATSYCFSPPLDAELPELAPYTSASKEKICIDLRAATVATLLRCGADEDKITTSTADTYANHNYFSHRRSCRHNEVEGRMATSVALR